MNGYRNKLQEGRQRLAQAGNDQSHLGMALIKIHAAHEDYLRVALHTHAGVPDDVKQIIFDVRTTNWLQLANLAQEYGILSSQERKLALDANGLRLKVAHGETVTLQRPFVERYLQLVESKIEARTGQTASLGAPAPYRAPDPPVTAHAPAAPPARRSGCVAPLVVLLVVGLLAGGFWLQRNNAAISSNAADTVAAPTFAPATPATAAEATAAPTVQQTRFGVVQGVGSAGLRVRSEPSLSGEILATKLSDGDRVEVVGGPQDADGHTWWQIRTGDSVGWCSGTYLLIE